MDYPLQHSGRAGSPFQPPASAAGFDMRDWLSPRRLTIVMWDQAFLLRHIPGESFQDFDRVLGQTVERGYNTVRLDPLPQLLDLSHPERVFTWKEPGTPFMPWGQPNRKVEGPVARWLLEFMEKVLRHRLHYTLSAWWFTSSSSNNPFPPEARAPGTFAQAAEIWATLLRSWQSRIGFDGLLYVDVVNEMPYFLPGFSERFAKDTGGPWSGPEATGGFTAEQAQYLAQEINPGLSALQRDFPAVRFTTSIHGDERWRDVPLQMDCMDVHFYADVDPRWRDRTCFGQRMTELFTKDEWHSDFSDRCRATAAAVAPMLRAAQRSRLAAFAELADRRGMPLTTSESWASWYYYDSPKLDWSWLLEWAEWSVEDAIEHRMWGWTPHNYCQPQFVNWGDARWHQRLTDRFLRS